MTALSQTLPQIIHRPKIALSRQWSLYRQRAQLAALDADALRDIGISRAQARAEAARPVWDAPDFWRR